MSKKEYFGEWLETLPTATGASTRLAYGERGGTTRRLATIVVAHWLCGLPITIASPPQRVARQP